MMQFVQPSVQSITQNEDSVVLITFSPTDWSGPKSSDDRTINLRLMVHKRYFGSCRMAISEEEVGEMFRIMLYTGSGMGGLLSRSV
jgi:hypothetical protein